MRRAGDRVWKNWKLEGSKLSLSGFRTLTGLTYEFIRVSGSGVRGLSGVAPEG